MTVRRQTAFCLALVLIAIGAGCGGRDTQPVAAEIDEPYYRQGQQFVKQGRTQEALALFLKVIEKRGEQSSAESHLEAGLIYLHHSKDPIEAYHHFRQYLAQPNPRQAAAVRALVDTAKLEFARTLPGQPFANPAVRTDLLEQLAKAKRDNEELVAENAALRAAAPLRTTRGPISNDAPQNRIVLPIPTPVIPVEEDSPVSLAPTQPLPANDAQTSAGNRAPPARPGATPAAGRRHVVEQGDTLFRLTQKYYGAPSTAKARAIFEANRDVMKSETDLRIGMELKIP
ncbi:MAG TPA: LysM peptidoglycan-binding domain-containing protein [Opitutaceae bacterium]|nr:LysM peptidoglycan-binding domain-containing protein [Opitutaceae bacterium]